MLTDAQIAESNRLRRWAQAEHATLLRIKQAQMLNGDNSALLPYEREARRKRNLALVGLRVALNDRTIPENGTDEEIGAYLGFDAATEGAANV